MLELSRFLGIVISMYYEQGGQHNKPHIHASYGDFSASVGIDGEVLDGAIPVKQLRLLQAWLILHEEELYANWNKTVQKIPLDKIDPLR